MKALLPSVDLTAHNKNVAERGELLVLIIGYVLLSLLVITAVTAASSLYLEHKKLLSAADGAAVAAADSFTLGQVSGGSGAPAAALTSGQVANSANRFLSESGAYARFDNLGVGAATGSADAHSAQVTLTAVAHPWLVSYLIPAGVPISASSTARAELQR